MYKIICFVVFAVVIVQAQERRCVAPRYFQAVVNSYDHETGYYRDGRFSYDAHEQRIRIIERIDENATRPQVDELVLHREKKRYRIDLKTRKCNVSTVNFPFHPIEVPEPSRYYGESVIGALERPEEGVRISTWVHKVQGDDVEGTLAVTYTTEECVPFTETFYGVEGKTKQPLHFHRTYLDVTIGLNDPNIFDVPEECKEK